VLSWNSEKEKENRKKGLNNRSLPDFEFWVKQKVYLKEKGKSKIKLKLQILNAKAFKALLYDGKR
jgi:hypothetical protein